MPVATKVAMVVDALPNIGGAEKVLMAAMELFPHAPIYTLLYNRTAFLRTPVANRKVHASYINRLPLSDTYYKNYFPLMPHAIRQFDLCDYDLILSFSYSVAHGVSTQPGQIHLSYTYTPMRYAWRDIGLNGFQRPQSKVLNFIFQPFRSWDLAVTAKIDRIAAVSHWIADWVERAYQRESTVIYPPVDVERFSPAPERDDYYITVSRLVSHKRVDLLLKAFNLLKRPLLVVGEGPEHSRLEHLSGPYSRLLGFQSDSDVAALLSRARAYVCAGEEDFGIAAVEAQAAGCPVIAYRKGGVLETVVEHETGLFFDEPTVGSLVDGIERFERQRLSFNSYQISTRAQCFNKERFFREFTKFVGCP
ncbi:MAG TPA: glycosyltransferase [Anaerolineales bacterium]|nr:glycosyltransferase [Anaerolineales bacterium]